MKLRPGSLVLVTGAGSGIGRATAHAFAAKGANVVVVDIDEVAAKTVADEVDGAAYRCDVADFESVQALANRVAAEHGTPDVLVNNAGVGLTGRFLDTSLEDWQWIRSINLDGVWHGCAAFGPAMVERGSGHVVNVSSGLGVVPHATEPAYCTTKAGVLMLSQCLRADWAREGVGVTAVCPGVINTPIIDNTRFKGEAADSRERAKKVFRRGHKPEAVAKAVVGAVERNRAVVSVGVEAKAGRLMVRSLPQPIQQLISSRSL
jgi:NAD(P)-dependent dehydrogenase (short-subunit alcohol dehydrogenase family)